MTIRYLNACIAIALAGCSSPPPPPKTETPAEPPKPAVRISQFYAATPHIGRGDRAALCYGVEGATDVRLSPPVEGLWPTMSRCFEVKPAATTTYTLTALDSSGHSVDQKVTVEVGPPSNLRGTGASGPRLIQEVTVSKLEVAPGEQVTICYTARNAASVTITPGQNSGPLSAQRGCVTDRPTQTTTYQVAATGSGGQRDLERVAVKVR